MLPKILICILFSLPLIAGEQLPDIFYVTPADDTPTLAVLIPMSDGEILDGFQWFNNDSATVFPEVRLASVDSSGVPDPDSFLVVANNLAGNELNWSSCLFEESISSNAGDLFLIISFPAGQTEIELGDVLLRF